MDRLPKSGLFENTQGFMLADQILSGSKIDAPELETAAPRKVELRGELDHSHGVSVPLLVVLTGVLGGFGYLCVLTYMTHHELPLASIALIVSGIGLLAFALFTRPPAGCDCKWQKLLIKTGTAVVGQITDKRANKGQDGTSHYELDYAFQTAESEESHWGSMRVNEQQFNGLDEGDDVTVLYCLDKKDLVSRLYSFCHFRAAKS